MSAPFRVILPASADREVWLTKRREGIGSSDVAKILGVASRGSAQHVYYDKHGELPPDEDAGEAALWGTLDEETTAREWARRNRSVVRRVGIIARRDAPHHMCTLDRLVAECPLDHDADRPGRCALEIKHRSAWLAGQWTRQIPDDVLAQVLWQIHVTGWDHLHVGCRIGGNDYRQYVIRRADHVDLIADIVIAVDRFWHGHVLAGRVPALTGEEHPDTQIELYDALYPVRGGFVDLSAYPALAHATVEDLRVYEEERLAAARHEAAKKAAQVRLIERLADKEVGVLHGEPAFQRTSTRRDGEPMVTTSIDLDRLAERHPEAYADCVTQKPARRFSIDKSYRLKESDVPA